MAAAEWIPTVVISLLKRPYSSAPSPAECDARTDINLPYCFFGASGFGCSTSSP
jgi:hypothetical protein